MRRYTPTYVCANIYACKKASEFLFSVNFRKNSRCGRCKESCKVAVEEADTLVAACGICSAITGRTHNPDLTRKCKQEFHSYCPFCNIEYRSDTKDPKAKSPNADNTAQVLKILLGEKSLNQMVKEMNSLIQKPEFGCDGICLTTKDILERMDENIKKKRFKTKVLTVLGSMQIMSECHERILHH